MSEQANLSLGKAMAIVRRYTCKTQRDIASNCGVSRSYLSEMESGKAPPSLTYIESLCRYVGISISGFFEIAEAIEHVKKDPSGKLRKEIILAWIDGVRSSGEEEEEK